PVAGRPRQQELQGTREGHARPGVAGGIRRDGPATGPGRAALSRGPQASGGAALETGRSHPVPGTAAGAAGAASAGTSRLARRPEGAAGAGDAGARVLAGAGGQGCCRPVVETTDQQTVIRLESWSGKSGPSREHAMPVDWQEYDGFDWAGSRQF